MRMNLMKKIIITGFAALLSISCSGSEVNTPPKVSGTIIQASAELFHEGTTYQFEKPVLVIGSTDETMGILFFLKPEYQDRDGVLFFEFRRDFKPDPCLYDFSIFKTLPGYKREVKFSENGKFDSWHPHNVDQLKQINGGGALGNMVPEKLGDNHYKYDCSKLDGLFAVLPRDTKLKAVFELAPF